MGQNIDDIMASLKHGHQKQLQAVTGLPQSHLSRIMNNTLRLNAPVLMSAGFLTDTPTDLVVEALIELIEQYEGQVALPLPRSVGRKFVDEYVRAWRDYFDREYQCSYHGIPTDDDTGSGEDICRINRGTVESRTGLDCVPITARTITGSHFQIPQTSGLFIKLHGGDDK